MDRARRAIRVANATADATQARLQQLSAAQTERRAAETLAETEARLDGERN